MKGGYVHPRTRRTCVLLSCKLGCLFWPRYQADQAVDDEMAYSAFSRDYGPLNLAFTYAACLIIHEKLGVSWLTVLRPETQLMYQPKESRSRPVCLYTSPDAETKSNMALMVALYFVSFEET